MQKPTKAELNKKIEVGVFTIMPEGTEELGYDDDDFIELQAENERLIKEDSDLFALYSREAERNSQLWKDLLELQARIDELEGINTQQWRDISEAGDYVGKLCWLASYHPDLGVFVTDDCLFKAARYKRDGFEVRYFMPYFSPTPPAVNSQSEFTTSET